VRVDVRVAPRAVVKRINLEVLQNGPALVLERGMRLRQDAAGSEIRTPIPNAAASPFCISISSIRMLGCARQGASRARTTLMLGSSNGAGPAFGKFGDNRPFCDCHHAMLADDPSASEFGDFFRVRRAPAGALRLKAGRCAAAQVLWAAVPFRSSRQQVYPSNRTRIGPTGIPSLWANFGRHQSRRRPPGLPLLADIYGDD
jgi:hypothetical protein